MNELLDVAPSDSTEPTIVTNPAKHKKPVGFFILITVFALAVVLYGISSFSKKTTQFHQTIDPQSPSKTQLPTENTQETEQVEATASNTVEWKTFVSELGFSFDYPSHWGTPTEKVLDAVEALQGDTGKTYQLTFSNTQEVYASGRSADFSAGRGGRQEDFGVNSNGKTSIEAYLDIVDPGCFTMGNQNSFRALIDFSLVDKPVGGVRLFLPIVSQSILEKIKEEFSIPSETIDCFSDVEAQNQLIEKGKEIRSMLVANTNLDPETTANLDIFTRVASSSSIIQ